MSTINLQKLFSPATVAVIGASERPQSVGQVVLRNLLEGGFAGTIYPVNPHHQTLNGLKVYPEVAALPTAPDLAIVCTPAATVAAIITALGQRGTRAAIVMSAGFSDDGSHARQSLLDAARPYRLRMLGPNCIGMINPRISLNASFAHMSADAGTLAFVAQSGALCTAAIDWARANGVGFTHVVSLGDMLDVDFGDVLDYLSTDSATRGVLMYVEGITAARKFLSAARAVSRNKPIFAIKAGRHAAGAQAARSHTGALAGSFAVFESALQRAGIVLVDSVEALFESAETLALSRHMPKGPRLCILTNGGGPGVLAADSVVTQGGTLATLPDTTIAHLDAVLPANWSRSNPVDIIGDAGVDRYLAALQVLERAEDIDGLLVMHVPTALLPSEIAAQGLAPVLAASRLPVLACFMGGVTAEPARATLAQQRVPAYATPKAAVTAFTTMVKYQRTQTLLMQTPPSIPDAFTPDIAAARAPIAAALAAGRDLLTEVEAKAVLRAYGFSVVETQFVPTPDAAVSAAVRMGFPVVMKIVSPQITHKSDVGGVALNLESPAAVRSAALAMLTRVMRQQPEAQVSGFSVQQMVAHDHAHELILGVATDPVFGPIILVGDGGTAVEVLADKAIALPPLNMMLAQDMLRRTRVYRLLRGYRDHPAVDLDAIAVDLVRLSQLIIDVPEIIELDINPLLVSPDTTIALDARIRVAIARESGAARLAIRPYPIELEEYCTLQNGRRILLRPIRPEDEAAHLAFCEKVDPQDMYFRFFTRARDFSHTQLARYTQIDYDREMAFIAVDPGSGETLGVVRAVSDANNQAAEFAILIRTDMQGLGLGTALMRKIVVYSRARGTGRLYGHVLNNNRGMLQLAEQLGFVIDYTTDDSVAIATLTLR